MIGKGPQFTLAEVFALGAPMTPQEQSTTEQPKKSGPRAASHKVKWSTEEDQILTRNIEQYGTSNWSLVAKALPGRTGKQCRERWMNQLDPQLNKDNWTPQEDALLLMSQRRFGNQWSKIMQFLPRRSCNAVKNRFCWLTRNRTHPPRLSQLLPYLKMNSVKHGAERLADKSPGFGIEFPVPLIDRPGFPDDNDLPPSLMMEGPELCDVNDHLDNLVMNSLDTVDSSDVILKNKWY